MREEVVSNNHDIHVWMLLNQLRKKAFCSIELTVLLGLSILLSNLFTSNRKNLLHSRLNNCRLEYFMMVTFFNFFVFVFFIGWFAWYLTFKAMRAAKFTGWKVFWTIYWNKIATTQKSEFLQELRFIDLPVKIRKHFDHFVRIYSIQ